MQLAVGSGSLCRAESIMGKTLKVLKVVLNFVLLFLQPYQTPCTGCHFAGDPKTVIAFLFPIRWVCLNFKEKQKKQRKNRIRKINLNL